MLVPRIISRNAHQNFTKIFPTQEADERPRRVLEPLNHVFAILDPSLADPGRDIVHEIPIAPEKVETMKPRNVNRFVKIARIKCGRRMGPGDSEVALYIEISPHTGMRANGLSSGNKAPNIAPPTFSK